MKEYADIEYSKQLADLFQDAEWWWIKPFDVNMYFTGEELEISSIEWLDYHGMHKAKVYPALTVCMLLEKLPAQIFVNKTYGYLHIYAPPTTSESMDKNFSIDYVSYRFHKPEGLIMSVIQDNSLPNALAKMLLFLKEKGLINEE